MKDTIVNLLSKETKLQKKQIENLLETPPSPELGDYAFPCFILSKTLKKNPDEIAKDLAKKLKLPKQISQVKATGPYVNFFVDKTQLATQTITEILKQKGKYGSSNQGKNKKILIDMSSPNIAKPFGIGHLRSTIIGNSIAKICEFQGYKSIKINYLGDWGTQFGKLIVSYRKFGSESKLKKDPIKHLLDLYVKVNKLEELEEQARQEFKKLEEGDKENLALWKKFRELSLIEFNEIYKKLNVEFDVTSGESVYNNKMEPIIGELRKKGLLEESEGAEIVNLENQGLGIALIKKSDGATLYATRDITAAISRYNQYKFHKMLYEVGGEQKLHFKQFFKILELMGYKWSKDLAHIDHGQYLGEDGKRFRTREGKTIFMKDILDETTSLAKKEINKREKITTKELEKRASTIAIAAIIYGDLKNYRSNNMVFDINRFVSFEGNTGPYLLYTYARAKSILTKAKYKFKQTTIKATEINDQEKQLILQLSKFSETAEQAYNQLAPNLIANYIHDTAQLFNEYYHTNKVIGSDQEQFKLSLVDTTSQVIKNGLNLLGIETLEKM